MVEEEGSGNMLTDTGAFETGGMICKERLRFLGMAGVAVCITRPV
jgi:hypothetical protein